ncbi:MAG TPA: hypothetical protein VEA69_20150 [Tepidisphaeraceae bacterium]|nr:hypothetical protein [Tepidisphaeraceae bacterium]
MFSTQPVATFNLDSLEHRMLLHGGGHGRHIRIPDPPSATIQADLDAVKAAQTAVRAQEAALGRLLRADRRAIKAAVAALAPTLQPLYDELKADALSWAKTLRQDRNAIKVARRAGDDVALQAAKDKYAADQAAAKAELKADADAIKAVIDADPAVIAARAKYDADAAPLVAAQDVLKAAKQKLKDDIAAGL